MTLGSNVDGTTGFALGRLARTTLPATTETFGANDDVQSGDNDSDTLREVQHLSNEGLALQARVYGS